MKAEAEKLFSFIRYKKITVFKEDEQTLKSWYKKSEKQHLTFIYFDSEEMWMDHQAANFVGFDWSRSKLNINHELLKDVYNLDEAELNSLSRVEKKEWLDDIDIMDKMTRRYELLVKEYKAFLQK